MAERYHLGVNRHEHPTMFVCREPACEIARHFYLAADYDATTAELAGAIQAGGDTAKRLAKAWDEIGKLRDALGAIEVALNDVRNGAENARSKLYRLLADAFPSDASDDQS